MGYKFSCFLFNINHWADKTLSAIYIIALLLTWGNKNFKYASSIQHFRAKLGGCCRPRVSIPVLSPGLECKRPWARYIRASGRTRDLFYLRPSFTLAWLWFIAVLTFPLPYSQLHTQTSPRAVFLKLSGLNCLYLKYLKYEECLFVNTYLLNYHLCEWPCYILGKKLVGEQGTK